MNNTGGHHAKKASHAMPSLNRLIGGGHESGSEEETKGLRSPGGKALLEGRVKEMYLLLDQASKPKISS